MAATVGTVVVAARHVRRHEVTGASMEPTLLHGERVLTVRPSSCGPRGLRPGRIVVVPDPRQPDRLIVKRVAVRSGRSLTVLGDNPGASTDSRVFGPISARSVRGLVVYRYYPPHRRGPVR